jgi:hypothetical protein
MSIDRQQQYGIVAVLVGLFIWAGLSIQSTFRNTAAEDGGTDIHSYWYAGLFVRQRMDPYAAYFANARPNAPVQHLDGLSTAESLQRYASILTNVPANTAPVVLLLTILSFFTWQSAKTIWLICNLGMMLSIPWLLWRYIKPSELHTTPVVKLVLALIFYGLLATRNSIGNGQTTIFVVFLMLLSLVMADGKRDVLGGLLLGIALSKYSVALPVFLLMVYRRNVKVVTIALITQVVGAVILSSICRTPLTGIINDYLQMMLYHSELEGIHLASYMPVGVIYTLIGALLVVVIMLGTLWSVFADGQPQTAQDKRLLEIHFLAAFTLAALLGVYHKNYDVLIAIAALALFLLVLMHPPVWNLTPQQIRLITVVWVGAVLVFSVPGESVTRFLPTSLSSVWLGLLRPIATSTIAILLLLSIWLTRRIVQRLTVV